jgi:hypothetical protein
MAFSYSDDKVLQMKSLPFWMTKSHKQDDFSHGSKKFFQMDRITTCSARGPRIGTTPSIHDKASEMDKNLAWMMKPPSRKNVQNPFLFDKAPKLDDLF